MSEVDLSNILKNYVTIAAILIGAGWALWKWEFSRWIRRKENIYSIDGELTISQKESIKGKNICTLSAIWKNKGDINIELEPKLIQIFVYKINNSVLEGHIDFHKDFGDPIHKIYPYSTIEKVTLGSGTESLMTHHIALEKENTYAISWHLYKKSKNKRDPSYYIQRDIIFNTGNVD